nr:hypothetical protein [uncultured Polynucleobacter sp.]
MLKNSSALNFDESNPEVFKVCKLLVNALSHMYGKWVSTEDPYAPGWLETFRLVNNADAVPKFPESLAFVDVGTQASFNADYGSERKTHDPCCSYAYALYNPDQPFNPDYDMCAAGTSSNTLLSHLNNEINK